MASVHFTEYPIRYLADLVRDIIGNRIPGYMDHFLNASQPFLTAASVLLIAYIGIRILLGYGDFKEAIGGLMKVLFVMAIIYGSTYGYKEFIYPGISGVKSFFVDSFIGGSVPDDCYLHDGSRHCFSVDTYSMLDNFHRDSTFLMEAAASLVEKFSPSTWLYSILGFIIGIFATFASFLIAFLLMGTELVLAFLVIIGPVFVCLYVFSSTRNFLFLWISALFSNVILFACAAFCASISIKIFNSIIAQVLQGTITEDNVYPTLFSVLLFMLLLIKISVEIPSIAQSLSGGTAAGSSAAALVKTAAAAMIGAGLGALAWYSKNPDNDYDKNKKNSDGSTRSPSKSPLGHTLSAGGAGISASTSLLAAGANVIGAGSAVDKISGASKAVSSSFSKVANAPSNMMGKVRSFNENRAIERATTTASKNNDDSSGKNTSASTGSKGDSGLSQAGKEGSKGNDAPKANDGKEGIKGDDGLEKDRQSVSENIPSHISDVPPPSESDYMPSDNNDSGLAYYDQYANYESYSNNTSPSVQPGNQPSQSSSVDSFKPNVTSGSSNDASSMPQTASRSPIKGRTFKPTVQSGKD